MSSTWRHLAVRFFTSVDPRGPPGDDEAWALSWLLPSEQVLWSRMSGPDRRHAAGVARVVVFELAPTRAQRDVVGAALLHDVGKVESALGTWGRVGATLAVMLLGPGRVAGWSSLSGWHGEAGRYVSHDLIGARLLAGVGSEHLTVAWAAEHHLPPGRWTVSPAVGAILKAADGD